MALGVVRPACWVLTHDRQLPGGVYLTLTI
jgi:hypothetical protein